MKKVVASLTTALVFIATTSIASSAQAQSWPTDCFFTEPRPLQTVQIDLNTLQVRIDPAAADDDADAIVTGATTLALCLENNLVLGQVNCLLAKAQEIAASINVNTLYFRYVYQDPTTGEFVIDGGRLLADAEACLAPLWPLS